MKEKKIGEKGGEEMERKEREKSIKSTYKIVYILKIKE